jgi:hypothetical protein
MTAMDGQGGDAMKKPHEMLFAEFAEAVRPTGAVNRLPPIGSGHDVLSYSVYMNGPMAKALPMDSQEHHYKDVMVHALTEKLGLNPESFRDNLKVAELVSVRGTWMSAVLEASSVRDISASAVILSDEVVNDYEALAQGLTHPWLREQIERQKALSKNLQPALQSASLVSGGPVVEEVPNVVNRGAIISQSLDFTVQTIGDGSVVAHENRRLAAVPAVGDNVTVTYYRGSGQVFTNVQDLDISRPYIDEPSGNLGVLVSNAATGKDQIVLFHGVAAFEKFVHAQNLPRSLMGEAFELQEHSNRTRVANAVVEKGKAMGVEIDRNKVIASLESKRGPDNGVYVGKVLGVDEKLGLILQSQGKGRGVVHLTDCLSRVPAVGEMAAIKFKDGRGTVADHVQGHDRGR